MVTLEGIYEKERSRIAALEDGAGDYHAPVFGEGSRNPLALVIGEAPGAEEAKLSRPFVGRAGKQLDELFSLAKIERGSLYVTNAVKFRPVKKDSPRRANRTPTAAEVKAALPCLRAEIALIAPRVIVTLGNTPLGALSRLCGEKLPPIGEIHGRPVDIDVDGMRTALIAHYHPASVIYNRGLKETLERDAVELGRHIQRYNGIS